MQKSRGFEDLEIWKEGMRISVIIYPIMQKCKDFSFRDQIQRAAVAIPANIAEGYERQTNKEFLHFLFVAKGSCGKLRTQIYLGRVVGYFSREEYSILINKIKILNAMIQKFIQSRQNST